MKNIQILENYKTIEGYVSKHELQANCYEEVKDRCTLAEKLGGSAVISLEGKPL